MSGGFFRTLGYAATFSVLLGSVQCYPVVKPVVKKSRIIEDSLELKVHTFRDGFGKKLEERTGKLFEILKSNKLNLGKARGYFSIIKDFQEDCLLNNKPDVIKERDACDGLDALEKLAVDSFSDQFSELIDSVEMLNEQHRKVIDAVNESQKRSADQFDKYGSIKSRAGLLTKMMIGEVPSINLKIKDVEDSGLSAFTVGSEVVTEDGSYAVTLSRVMHEIGHHVTKYREMNNNSLRRDVRLMEEAGAYAFQFAAPYYEMDETLRKEMFLYNSFYVEYKLIRFFDGSALMHNEAVAIADAAITYFNNPKDAFNYLTIASYADLNPEIVKIIYDNKRVYRGFLEALNFDVTEGFRKIRDLKNEAQEMMADFEPKNLNTDQTTNQ